MLNLKVHYVVIVKTFESEEKDLNKVSLFSSKQSVFVFI